MIAKQALNKLIVNEKCDNKEKFTFPTLKVEIFYFYLFQNKICRSLLILTSNFFHFFIFI